MAAHVAHGAVLVPAAALERLAMHPGGSAGHRADGNPRLLGRPQQPHAERVRHRHVQSVTVEAGAVPCQTVPR